MSTRDGAGPGRRSSWLWSSCSAPLSLTDWLAHWSWNATGRVLEVAVGRDSLVIAESVGDGQALRVLRFGLADGVRSWDVEIEGIRGTDALLTVGADVVMVVDDKPEASAAVALGLVDGAERWRREGRFDGFVAADDLVVGIDGPVRPAGEPGLVVGLDAVSGAERWRYDVGLALQSERQVVGDVLVGVPW